MPALVRQCQSRADLLWEEWYVAAWVYATKPWWKRLFLRAPREPQC